MIRLDHLAIPVRDRERSREWYATHFGFRVEFEVPERKTVALEDDAGLTLFLVESAEPPAPPFCTLTFQIDDVEAKHRELTARRARRSSSGGTARSCGIPTATSCTSGTSGPCGRRETERACTSTTPNDCSPGARSCVAWSDTARSPSPRS
jgi:hypothetical protein